MNSGRELITGSTENHEAVGLQRLVEHERINIACPRMVERFRKFTDGFETCTLPRSDRSPVRADDKVELHGSITLRSRVFD
jgi:hypothetical protein